MEKNSDNIAKERFVSQNPNIVTSFGKDGDLFQFQFKSDILLTSTKPLKPAVHNLDTLNEALIPDLYPVHHTISIAKDNFYVFQDFYRKYFNTFLHTTQFFYHFIFTVVSFHL